MDFSRQLAKFALPVAPDCSEATGDLRYARQYSIFKEPVRGQPCGAWPDALKSSGVGIQCESGF
jgi:hypothetical protein